MINPAPSRPTICIAGPSVADMADHPILQSIAADHPGLRHTVAIAAAETGWDVVYLSPVRVVPLPTARTDAEIVRGCAALLLLPGWEMIARCHDAWSDAVLAGVPIFDYLADGVPAPGDPVLPVPVRPVFDPRLPSLAQRVEVLNRLRSWSGVDLVVVRRIDMDTDP